MTSFNTKYAELQKVLEKTNMYNKLVSDLNLTLGQVSNSFISLGLFLNDKYQEAFRCQQTIGNALNSLGKRQEQLLLTKEIELIENIKKEYESAFNVVESSKSKLNLMINKKDFNLLALIDVQKDKMKSEEEILALVEAESISKLDDLITKYSNFIRTNTFFIIEAQRQQFGQCFRLTENFFLENKNKKRYL